MLFNMKRVNISILSDNRALALALCTGRSKTFTLLSSDLCVWFPVGVCLTFQVDTVGDFLFL